MTKKEIKAKLWPKNPELQDSFVYFNGNRNQPRKRLDITMRAFKMFSEDKPDNVKIYLHCGLIDASINVAEMSQRLDLGKRLIITAATNGIQQIPESKLNEIYNATEVGLNTGLGEGFGLVNIEHLVTGAPQIVPDNSANTELYEDCGLLVPTITDWTLDTIMTTGSIVRPEDVAERMQRLYVEEQLYNSLSQKGIDKFTSPEYNWANISKLWDKLFREVLK
jgi:glycosyltransferase involved in cell wall biosynthesis